MSWQTEVADFWAEELRLFDQHDKYEYLIQASTGELYHWIRNHYSPYGGRHDVRKHLTDIEKELLMQLFGWFFDEDTVMEKHRKAMAKALAVISTKFPVEFTYRESFMEEQERKRREQEQRSQRARRMVSSGSWGRPVFLHDEVTLDLSDVRIDTDALSRLMGEYSMRDAELSFGLMEGTRTGRMSSSRPNVTERPRREYQYIRLHNGAEFPLSQVDITTSRRAYDRLIEVRLRVHGTDVDLRCLISDEEAMYSRERLHDLILRHFQAEIVSRRPMDEEPRLQIRELSPTQRIIEERRERGERRQGFPPELERQYQRSRGR